MLDIDINGTLINAATLDGVTTVQQAVIPFIGRHSISLLWTWTSTLVATLTLELSNNFDSQHQSLSRWAPVTDAAISGYLNDGSVGGGKPNGTAGSAFLQLDPIRCSGIRYTVTRTAGSGLFTLDVEGL